MANTIINGLIGLLFTVLAAIITSVLLPAISNWLKSKTENEKLHTVIDDLTKTVQTSVNMLEQTTVKQLKMDGKWDATHQEQVMKSAVVEVMSNITSTTYNALTEQKCNVEQVVTRYIESYIQSKKTNKTVSTS